MISTTYRSWFKPSEVASADHISYQKPQYERIIWEIPKYNTICKYVNHQLILKTLT